MVRWIGVIVAGCLLGCRGGAGPSSGHSLTGNRPPEVQVEAPADYCGYGELVRLAVSARDPDDDPLQFRWEQVAGPTLALRPGPEGELSFQTHELEQVAPLEAGPIQVLPLVADRAGRYVLRLHVTDGTNEVHEDVTVHAWSPNPGWPRAEMGVATVLDAGLEQDEYRWVFSLQPPRTEPRFEGADRRRPVVTFFSPGRYVVKEEVSGRELGVHSGPFLGTQDCGRVECHPLELQGWATTKMATVFQRGIDGQLRQDYGPRCVRCHTVGWNEKTKNDGFDDVAIEVGWDFPQRLALGNSRSLPSKLEDRANVGCEACHGAGRFYTSYSSEVCALCHDAAPDYVNPREWRLAPMSTLREGTTEKATCRRCHTVQGFLDEYYGHRPVELTARPGDAQFEAEPVTCPACHDVHQGQLTRLVRGGGSLVGQNPDVSWGTGMVCLFCHHGGSQWVFPDAPVLRPFVPREINIVRPFKVSLWNRRLAPHAPQADMIRGRAGHALPGPGLVDLASPHLSVPGGCVGCHVRQRPAPGDGRLGLVGGHTFAMFHGEGEDRVENTDACAPCHGQLSSLSRPVHYDYDGNGRIEGIYEEVNGLLERTHRAVQKAITDLGLSDGGRRGVDVGEYDGRVVVVDEEGNYLGRPPRPMTIPDGQERLYRAVYNYLTVVKDRSKGVHNPVWTVRILQRTAKRLNPEDIPQWDWR